MDITKLSDSFSVSPQINVEDCALIVKRGFKSIICNRPDNECDTQPLFLSIREEAGRLGLITYYLPVTSDGITEDDKHEFELALSTLPKPILAYCRTGNRSGILYSMLSK